MGKLSSIKHKIKNVSIIRTSSPAIERIKGRPGARMRDRILKRDDYLCQECLRAGRVRVADEVDHVVPLSVGGSNADDNQRSLCRDCHAIKCAAEELARR